MKPSEEQNWIHEEHPGQLYFNLLQHNSQGFLALPATHCEAKGLTFHLQHSVEGTGRVTADSLDVLVRNLEPRLLPVIDLRTTSRFYLTV